MTDRELMQQALEALERCVATCFDRYTHEQVMSSPEHFVNQNITALCARLAHTNEFNPDWDAMAVMVEEQQRMAKRIAALEAQPEQEPVAWATRMGEYAHIKWGAKRPEYPMAYEIPLYTTPPQRKPLTDEEILDMADGCTAQYHDLLSFARAIEAAHGIKENT